MVKRTFHLESKTENENQMFDVDIIERGDLFIYTLSDRPQADKVRQESEIETDSENVFVLIQNCGCGYQFERVSAFKERGRDNQMRF